eukprot:GHVO01037526.1.p1 GENE.GHVO01037526.1~~GHVO01037526.1.p1  ORF type:complete len:197 (-),score=5.05 GHVO01037526.1:744-1334(-)
MKILKRTLVLTLIFFCASAYSSFNKIEELAAVMSEAKVLVETRVFLKGLNDQRIKGIKIDKAKALEVAARVELIASNENLCLQEEVTNVLRSQAYALVAGINGILSKESRNIILAKKSYHSLAKAKELNPNNTDAIKGQAVALKMVLSKNWVLRKLAATSLGINLRDAQKELIDDLRRFPDRQDFVRLADHLEDKL